MSNKKEICNLNQRTDDTYTSLNKSDIDTFINTFADAFVLFDEDLNCIGTNTAAEKLLGHTKAGAAGKHIIDIVPKIEETNLYGKLTGIIQKNEPCQIDKVISPMSSGEIRLSVAAFKVGNSLGLIARESSENNYSKLSSASDQLNYLFTKYITDVIYTMDMDMRLTYISPSITRQQGYTAEELISLKFRDVMPLASAELFKQILKEELHLARQDSSDSARSRTVELEVFCKDGTPLWTEQTITLLRDQEGKLHTIVGVARDISERKRSEKALHDSEAELATLVENLSDAVFRFKEGKLIWGNDRIVDMLGYKKDELLYTDVSLFMPDDKSLPQLYRDVSHGLKKEGSFQGFTRAKRRDGTLVDVEYSATPIPGRVPIELVGVARDITERRKLLEELENKEQFLRVLTEKAFDAFVIINADGTIKYKSPANELMQGYTTDEREGGDILQHVHPDDLARIAGIFGKLFNNPDEVIHTEVRIQHKEGHWLNIEAVARNFLNNPALNCIVVNVRDITERKQYLYQLERKTKQIIALQGITASMQSAQDLTDILKLVAEAVVVNLGFEHVLVFSKQNGISHATRFFTMADAEFISELEGAICKNLNTLEIPVKKGQNRLMDDSLDGSQTISHNLFEMMGPVMSEKECNIVQNLTGAKTIVHMPFYAGHEFLGGILALTMKDCIEEDEISPLKLLADHAGIAMQNFRLNRQLGRMVEERTKQLEAANNELESFAYSVSHDLRAPLRSIDGFSQILLDDYTEKLDNDGKDYLRRVRKGTQRMSELIEGILKLSRLTRGELQLKSVDLSAIVQSIADDLKRQQPERRVEFVITPGLIAKCDENLMRSVLDNLIGNAWKFTGKLENARIEFGSLKKDDRLAYYVKDNGAGFSMEFVEKLFGAFQRLHTSDEFEGTGIGLATVRRIIRRHGGDVWAEGVVNEGATFYFTI